MFVVNILSPYNFCYHSYASYIATSVTIETPVTIEAPVIIATSVTIICYCIMSLRFIMPNVFRKIQIVGLLKNRDGV